MENEEKKVVEETAQEIVDAAVEATEEAVKEAEAIIEETPEVSPEAVQSAEEVKTEVGKKKVVIKKGNSKMGILMAIAGAILLGAIVFVTCISLGVFGA